MTLHSNILRSTFSCPRGQSTDTGLWLCNVCVRRANSRRALRETDLRGNIVRLDSTLITKEYNATKNSLTYSQCLTESACGNVPYVSFPFFNTKLAVHCSYAARLDVTWFYNAQWQQFRGGFHCCLPYKHFIFLHFSCPSPLSNFKSNFFFGCFLMLIRQC